MKIRALLILGVLTLAACHGRPVSQINPLHAAHNAMTDHLLTANMGALQHSRQWGSASIGDGKHGVDVAVTLDNEPEGASERAFIAKSNCSKPSSQAWKPLSPVKSGKSQTHVPGVTVGEMKKGRYAIVVEQPGTSGRAVSCGDFEL